jgi:hydroxyquinol 1,2-dioxygenase
MPRAATKTRTRQPARAQPARPLHDRCRRALPFPQHPPAGYSLPDDGPVGQLARRIGLSLDRPAHIHFAVTAAGYARLVTSIFDGSDPAIGRDALFAVKPGLIGDFRAEKSGVSLVVALVLDRDPPTAT